MRLCIKVIWACIGVMGALAFVLSAVVTIGGYLFDRGANERIDALFSDASVHVPVTDRVVLKGENVPLPVQKYFNYVLRNAPVQIWSVRLQHTGTFRIREDQEWMPVRGEEYFLTAPPSFVWSAKAGSAPLFRVSALDEYVEGKGSMMRKAFSLLKMTDVSGEEVDQTALFRYLSETPLFPTALLQSEYLTWESIDLCSSRVSIRSGGRKVSAVAYFNGRGEITHMVSEDGFRIADGAPVREKWTGYYRKYKDMQGVKIPTEIEAVWNLRSGDFSYARFRVIRMEYNTPSRYKKALIG